MSLFRARRRGLDVDGEPVVARVVPRWSQLGEPERQRLLGDTDTLLRSKSWEAARGFELTEARRTHIAAQAAVLVLGLHVDAYRRVGTIIVHASTIVRTGERPGPAPGLMTDEPLPLLGEAGHGDGPMLLAWNRVALDTRRPQRGQNVVFHEFAHKLDMGDGDVDGVPPIPDGDQRDRWRQVSDDVFARVERGKAGDVLRDYAAVSRAEFFAVSTEVFFTVPHVLQDQEPELYDVLRAFYRQDPAALAVG